MIPAKLHFIWLGPRPVPEAWLRPWREMHPTWEVKLWREADIAALSMSSHATYEALLNDRCAHGTTPDVLHYEELLADRCWHGAADVARYEILLAEGGVYVDVDSKPLLSFDQAPFMQASFFAAYEPIPSIPGRVANGTIGAEKGHHILRQLVRAVAEMEVVQPPWDTIGGTALTAILSLHRHCPCQPMILPARTFYATDAHGRPVPGRETAYSEHFWATTNRGYAGRVVVLFPRRAGDPVRDRAWEFVKERWAAEGWPIYVGTHDEGPWNAAAARNDAARQAGDWDVAVFPDADTIPRDFETVRKGIAMAVRSGHFVRPFRRYVNLDEPTSEAVLETGNLPQTPRRSNAWLDGSKVLTNATGGIAIVPRDLWDRVGGYDERFAGWGSEDTAFALACSVLGGLKEIDGEVWHLWHPLQERDPNTVQYQANVALRRRYERARRPSLMRDLIAERDPAGPLRVGLVIITNGRKDCISRTIPSIEAQIKPAFVEKLICDDSGDPGYAAWLRQTFGGYVVFEHKKLGHGGAVAYALRRAAQMEVDWVFFCEDDYEFSRSVDLEALAQQMRQSPSLTQMVIRRQGWFPAEIEAGGMIERFDPALFTEHYQNGATWIEHRQFYSLNPHLTRRSFIAAHPWPATPNSEHHFSRRLFRASELSAGIWGAKADEPWARHFGERTGSGY